MRDSKDPMPMAGNTERVPPDGNSPGKGEKCGSKMAEHITGDQRFTLRKGGETQPTRQGGDGNMPATGEKHDSSKAEYVREDKRW